MSPTPPAGGRRVVHVDCEALPVRGLGSPPHRRPQPVHAQQQPAHAQQQLARSGRSPSDLRLTHARSGQELQQHHPKPADASVLSLAPKVSNESDYRHAATEASVSGSGSLTRVPSQRTGYVAVSGQGPRDAQDSINSAVRCQSLWDLEARAQQALRAQQQHLQRSYSSREGEMLAVPPGSVSVGSGHREPSRPISRSNSPARRIPCTQVGTVPLPQEVVVTLAEPPGGTARMRGPTSREPLPERENIRSHATIVASPQPGPPRPTARAVDGGRATPAPR